MSRAFVSISLILVLAGCGSGPEKAAAIAPPAQADVASFTCVVSGDTAGFIVPCGCTTKQFGGLPRRATYLEDLRKTVNRRLVYVDAGGSVQRGTAYDAIKFEHIAKGMAAMNVAVLNIGAGEMLLGPQTLRKLASVAPLFSTNVRAAENCEIPWPDHIEVELPPESGGIKPVRLAFLGVCLDAKSSREFSVILPHAALQQRIPELAKTCDAVMLLAYGSEADVLKLAADFPELTAVFVSGCAQSITPRSENGVVIAGATQKGKFLARATINGRRNNWQLASGEIVELSEAFADNPEQLENLKAYKQRLKTEKLKPSLTGESPALLANLPSEYHYAGSAACAKCHVQDATIFQASQHAHGLETLRNKDFAFDPFCLKCHTTGYGGPGGFIDAQATPEFGGIGCENCHGPSLKHTFLPRVKTLFSDAKSVCLSCHDAENSPKFDYRTYWAKIMHGMEKVK